MQPNILNVAEAVSDKFDTTTAPDKVAAPIEIIVVGGAYTGTTSIGSIIEKALLDAGLTNVTVANPEETQEDRFKMIETWRNQNSEEENTRFFGKPITIHTARAQFKAQAVEDKTLNATGTGQLSERMAHFGNQMRHLIAAADKEGIQITLDILQEDEEVHNFADKPLGFQDIGKVTTVHPIPLRVPNRFYTTPLSITCQSVVLSDIGPSTSGDFERVNHHVYLGEGIPPKKL